MYRKLADAPLEKLLSSRKSCVIVAEVSAIDTPETFGIPNELIGKLSACVGIIAVLSPEKIGPVYQHLASNGT